MTRLILTLPDDNKKTIDAFKKMAEIVGVKVKVEKEQDKPAKQPRTQLQQDFVDAYKEALAAERGEIELQPIENLIDKLKAKRQNAAH